MNEPSAAAPGRACMQCARRLPPAAGDVTPGLVASPRAGSHGERQPAAVPDWFSDAARTKSSELRAWPGGGPRTRQGQVSTAPAVVAVTVGR